MKKAVLALAAVLARGFAMKKVRSAPMLCNY